jgi:hypothetical protein
LFAARDKIGSPRWPALPVRQEVPEDISAADRTDLVK